MLTIAKKIHAELLQADNILIVSHKNPDGDTLSSACALMQYLRRLGKNHTAFCATPINKNLSFLPHLEYFIMDPEIFRRRYFDIIVIFDSGDLSYAGVKEQMENLDYSPTLINIDHHPTNRLYGHHNLVLPEAASTTEILYRFFEINNIALDQHIATCLLTGIVTDTAHFSNPATTIASLKIASRLMERGANLRLIQGWTLKNKTMEGLKLWGKVFGRLKKNEEYDIATAIILAEDLENQKLADEEIEGLANFLNNLSGAKIILLLKEKKDGTVKASLRTTQPDIDVSKIAQLFNGGGHAKAAGFSVKGRLVEKDGVWRVV
ncbi:MAG: bifunctional oligoribonuclease/PAP phosphatase NrnA [Candidatus Magasanikbacteria bacterium]|nr:bifunctional oligoribonuclease/PAP phosphatase NrnA [Candidatus Magasanikbacteria bacterium]